MIMMEKINQRLIKLTKYNPIKWKGKEVKTRRIHIKDKNNACKASLKVRKIVS